MPPSRHTHYARSQPQPRWKAEGQVEIRKADADQVSRIKERVEEKEGIPPAQQRLIYGGKQMYVSPLPPTSPISEAQMLMPILRRADDKTAADYQLEGGATLHLVLALRGGL